MEGSRGSVASLIDRITFKANHPQDGTLENVGALFKITPLDIQISNCLKDGVLVSEDTDGSDVTCP